MSTSYLTSPAPDSVEQLEPKPQTPPFKASNAVAVNAVSFGFIAMAVLVSVFLVVAVIERLLRSRRPALVLVTTSQDRDLGPSLAAIGRNLPTEKQDSLKSELEYIERFSVIMPGRNTPSYIAQPVPFPASSDSLNRANSKHATLDPHT